MVYQEIFRLLGYGQQNLRISNSLQEQLNSIITEDDLETLIVDTDTVIAMCN